MRIIMCNIAPSNLLLGYLRFSETNSKSDPKFVLHEPKEL
jgi:hypothetical protein